MPRVVHLRVYAELNDLIPSSWRGRWVPHLINGSVAVRDLVERVGIPHTEVDLVLVDGESVGLGHTVHGDEHISVFPVFETLDITAIQKVRPQPLRRTAFVLDVHLGRLARYLRMMGFDCRYDRTADDTDLAARAAGGCILLTRDRGLLKRRTVTHGYLVRARHPRAQAAEILRRFDLLAQIAPFTRCVVCNERLVALDPEAVPASVPPRVRERQAEFARCPGCGAVYWKGTHHRAMTETIRAIVEEAGSGPTRTWEPAPTRPPSRSSPERA